MEKEGTELLGQRSLEVSSFFSEKKRKVVSKKLTQPTVRTESTLSWNEMILLEEEKKNSKIDLSAEIHKGFINFFLNFKISIVIGINTSRSSFICKKELNITNI